MKIQTASEIYDDVITALRSDGVSIELVIDIISDLRKIPHEVLPTTTMPIRVSASIRT